jgi:hypothetical protein
MTDPREEPETELPLEAERALELALRSAWQPAELDPARHEALLALCLEDPFADATPEEVIESERLRRALDGETDHPDAALARALRASHTPSEPKHPLPELPKELGPAQAPSRGRVIYVAFGAATTLLAAAAAIALVIGSVTSRGPMTAAQKSESAAPAPAVPGAPAEFAARGASESLAKGSASGESFSRSSAPLFHEPFTLEQTTARIDRIAAVRERELRSNLYRSWGLK